MSLKLDIEAWMEKYYWIAKIMGYNVSRDREATLILASILRDIEPPLGLVREVLRDNDVVVFGAGPSLDSQVDMLLENRRGLLERSVLVAADGASEALLERGLTPNILVTDLDGGDDIILDCARRGSVLAIHAHGDNIGLIKRLVPEILKYTKKIIGTTQVEPIPPIQNFGGFTDGDRGVFLAWNFDCKRIFMVGMDFGDMVGLRSKPWLRRNARASREKLLKLKIAEELVSWLATIFKAEIYTFSEHAPKGVSRVRVEDTKDDL